MYCLKYGLSAVFIVTLLFAFNALFIQIGSDIFSCNGFIHSKFVNVVKSTLSNLQFYNTQF